MRFMIAMGSGPGNPARLRLAKWSWPSCGVRKEILSLVILVCLGLVFRNLLLENLPASWQPVLTSHFLARKDRRRSSGAAGNADVDMCVRAASYTRFSSDMQREESNADQLRKCEEKAGTNGHRIVPELRFADEAISGTKRNREGLNALVTAAEAGEIDVLYLYSLSRLSRESVITLPLLKHLVYNCGVRVISVTEGIDSNDTSWELIAHIMSIVHEQYVKDLADSVFRGQEGIVLTDDDVGISLGDYCLGYSSAPIPGSEGGGAGRRKKPRMMYVIDPESSVWVARIFYWFVQERRSLRWITRELNRLGAPKDHRAKTTTWRHQYLPRLLRNRKYLGWWSWGAMENVRDPLTGKIRQEERSTEDCEQWLRHLPHLQLIDEETFAEAQRILDANAEAHAAGRNSKGQWSRSRTAGRSLHPQHLLAKLIVCSHCESTFNVGGANAKYLFCPGYATGECPCRTTLRRDRAERMILGEIGQRILENPIWREEVYQATLAAWNAQEATLPAELASARRCLAEVEQKITNLLNRMEEGPGGPELDARLSKRRVERRELSQGFCNWKVQTKLGDRNPQLTGWMRSFAIWEKSLPRRLRRPHLRCRIWWEERLW